jgi:Family of unknown function (DUF5684)
MALGILAQTQPAQPSDAAMMIFLVIWLAVFVLMIASMWKVFAKAGQPGWAAIVPIYNIFVMLRVAGKPMWWFILLLIPVVNIIVGIMVVHAVSVNFGKGVGFTLGLIFLSIIFLPVLAFGSAEYNPRMDGMGMPAFQT